MQINITFRKMDPEERIKAYVEEKLAKVKKYLNEPIEAHVVLSTEKFRKGAEVNITADGLVINGSENREDDRPGGGQTGAPDKTAEGEGEGKALRLQDVHPLTHP